MGVGGLCPDNTIHAWRPRAPNPNPGTIGEVEEVPVCKGGDG